MFQDVLRWLFYLALIGSISVYGWRLYRHVVHHETRHDRAAKRREADEHAGTGTPDEPARPAAAPSPPVAPAPTATPGAMPAVPPASRAKRDRTPPPSVPTDPIEDGALVRDVIRQELAKKQAAQSGALEVGAAAADGTSIGADAATGRTGMFAKPNPPVAELLAGISLPCDLAPLVDRDSIDPTRVVFATAGHAPATVAGALADELERLGFRIDTVGDRRAVARKPEGELHITIHDDLAAFPTAPRMGVVVELTS